MIDQQYEIIERKWPANNVIPAGQDFELRVDGFCYDIYATREEAEKEKTKLEEVDKIRDDLLKEILIEDPYNKAVMKLEALGYKPTVAHSTVKEWIEDSI